MTTCDAELQRGGIPAAQVRELERNLKNSLNNDYEYRQFPQGVLMAVRDWSKDLKTDKSRVTPSHRYTNHSSISLYCIVLIWKDRTSLEIQVKCFVARRLAKDGITAC